MSSYISFKKLECVCLCVRHFFSLSQSLHNNCTLVWLGAGSWSDRANRWSLGGLGGGLEDGLGVVFGVVWGSCERSEELKPPAGARIS